MTGLMMALVIGVLFTTGTYLMLQRTAIRLILGLTLLGHGVNLLLFSGGGFRRGLPPIVVDKEAFTGDISAFVDPLPQALILTAIVISFGITAFMVVLVNRRHALVKNQEGMALTADDPFAINAKVVAREEEDYEYHQDTLVLLQRRSQKSPPRNRRPEIAKEVIDL
ncbi:MAG: NADH-quinone oxidoreductase subunit K [Caldilineaceae bacterium]|nr:NADH-quinone oxidoreductase subunit K [Caldilineaceae bacterium]